LPRFTLTGATRPTIRCNPYGCRGRKSSDVRLGIRIRLCATGTHREIAATRGSRGPFSIRDGHALVSKYEAVATRPAHPRPAQPL
jgi:hypothetical protein